VIREDESIEGKEEGLKKSTSCVTAL
jgi:hypothetical protein